MKGNFQIIVIVVFIAAALFGIMVFAGVIPIGNKGNSAGGQGTVTLWGSVPATAISSPLEDFNRDHPTFVVKYVQKSPETFNQELLEALASGTGPDMFFLPDNLVYSYSNKIFTIPYASYPVSSFQNTFAGAGEVFMTSKGILAFPLAVDPLLMYYNRSILDANNIVYPPAYWDELVGLIPTLTKKDDSNKIIKSAVAMGQYSNVAHAKDILSTLFMQTGNKIVTEKEGDFISVMAENTSQFNLAGVLKFYTDFADPLKSTYSWNRSFSNSSDSFSAENLAFYFGYASELPNLIKKNPNENFLIAPMPQIKSSKVRLTSARVTGIAISAFSKNFNTAFLAASQMATGDFASRFATNLGIAPVRRDLLKVSPGGSYFPTFYSSALYARSWLDPSSKDTDNIFRLMVERVLSNNLTPEDSIRDAGSKLGLLLFK